MNELLAAHRHTSKNRGELEASSTCGCCSCVEIFSPLEIVAWTGLDMAAFDNPDADLNDPEAMNNETALCPKCGSEALIGDKSGYPITQDFLNRMNLAWFQKTFIRRPERK